MKNEESRLCRFVCRVATRYYLRKPALEPFLAAKFPSLSSLAKGAANELAFRLGLKRSFFLTSVNLEVTNHCNLSCSMCPVNRSMKRPKGFMETSLFKKILQETPSLDAVLPFQWGEPLLHPDIVEMIAFASGRGLRVYMTTNGVLLDSALSQKLLDAGITRLTFSVDGSRESHKKIRGYDLEDLKKKILHFKEQRDKGGYKTKIDISMVSFEETSGEEPGFFSEWEEIADRVQAIPRFVSKKRTTKCRELWRGNLVVLFDGKVILCCADPEGVMEIGNARETPLAKIWNGAKMKSLRKDAARGRPAGLCARCGEYESPTAPSRFT